MAAAVLSLSACEASSVDTPPEMRAPDLATPADGPVDAAMEPTGFLGVPESQFESWRYRAIGGYACGDGSTGGVLVNLTKKSRRLLVFLDGRGACWDADGCIGPTPTAFLGPVDDGMVQKWFGTHAFPGDLRAGVFDRTDATNPFRDDNFVYLVDCGGDAFLGANLWPYMLGNGKSATVFHFGYQNVAVALGQLTAAFADTPRLVLAGAGTGGIGALGNYWQVATAFAAVKGPLPILVDDAGPVFSATWLSTATQATFQDAWGIVATVDSYCPACAPKMGTGYVEMWRAVALARPGMRGAFVSSSGDAEMVRLYSRLDGDPMFDAPKFRLALDETGHAFDAAEAALAPARLRYFYYPGAAHGALATAPLSTTPGFADFLAKELADDPAWKSVF